MQRKDVHQRARILILEQASWAIEPEAAVWLEAHLVECGDCKSYEVATREAILALRGVSELPSPALVRATQRSVRLTAKSLGDMESQRRMLVVSCALAAVWGAVMQPYMWRLFGWAGGLLEVPAAAWQSAYVAAWLLPGIVSVLLLAHLPLPKSIRRSLHKGGAR